MLRTLRASSTDEDIKRLVVEWSELLAEKRFEEALAMFESTRREGPWTPELLEAYIRNYGCAEPLEGEPPAELTSLRALPNAEEVIARSIQVNRRDLYGLDPATYVGMVHYYDVPLDGHCSDLTARFHIKKRPDGQIVLEFVGIHVT